MLKEGEWLMCLFGYSYGTTKCPLYESETIYKLKLKTIRNVNSMQENFPRICQSTADGFQ